MAVVRWLPEVLNDRKRLHAFIKPHSRKAAKHAVDTLSDAARGSTELPEKGRPWDLEMDCRELPVRFGARGYMFRYRYVDNEVFVVRVWHAQEDC